MKTSITFGGVVLSRIGFVVFALCFGGWSLARGQTLIAEYPFSQPASYYAQDTSGNNNNLNGGSIWGESGQTQFSTNGIAGGGSLLLDGGESISESSPPPDQTFDNLLATFYGSFSVSLWLNTTNEVGNDSDDLDGGNGATIIWAYDDHNNGINGTIPIALTGSKVAFFTGDPTGENPDTLHSTNSVTTGQFVHVVVTWDQFSGQKTIYINGVLDSSDTVAPNNLDGNDYYYSIGGVAGSSYAGLLDDVQFYSGVLNSNQVAFLYANPGTPVPNVTAPSTGPVAFYDFDEGTDLAADLTDNGNNLIYGGSFTGPVLSSNSISGSGAVYFNGGSFLTPSSNLLPTLAGNFSLSLWMKSTQDIAWDTAPAYYGAGIVAADMPGTTNDLIPMALTGGTIGFNTGSATNDDTLNSTTDINDGNYHHIVVTRNQATGEKQIYIDGIFSTNDFATTNLLNSPELITIGALADASQSDPTSPESSGYQGFVGLLDDIQIYSRVVTAAEVSSLYTHPGSNVTNGLVCHYDFDEGTVLAADVSGHGNNMVFAGSLMYNAPGPAVTNVTESGAGALSFNGSEYLVPQGNLPAVVSSNFSLSVWLQTTQSLGTAGGPADNGAGIVTAQVQSQSYDLTPLALTGGKIAFDTDGYSDDLLTSQTAINDGNYHHVVVTRDMGTGQKQIFIDGTLDSSDVGDTALLNNPQILILGAFSDASQSNPNSPGVLGTNGYVGLMDQLQIYPRVLSSEEVTYLYNNPGATLATGSTSSGPPFSVALGDNLVWSTSGDAAWFTETNTTFSTNAAAAESGSLQDGQSSVLQTTVIGPGTLSFYWETTANSDDFDLEFDMDGSYQNDISGQSSWAQFSVNVDSGTHTLTWNANTLGNTGSSPTDAGFLDQVSYVQNTAPIITLNPFNQTNSPGYNVALLAAATNSFGSVITWQWFDAGDGSAISGATNALFIPADSGTAEVAGSYYAVASTAGGSVNTTTALVSFVTAPLPPPWSYAAKSPFSAVDSTTVTKDYYLGCAVDSAGEVYASVEYIGNMDVLTNGYVENILTSAGSGGGAALVKHAANGSPLWAVGLTNNATTSSSYGLAVAPAPGNGAYLAASASGTNWLGTNQFVDVAGASIVLSRFDTYGSNVWSRFMTGSNVVVMNYGMLAADSSSNVTLAGNFSGTASLGGTNFSVPGGAGFIVQFATNGVVRWAESVPDNLWGLTYGNGLLYVSIQATVSGGVTNVSIGSLSNLTDRAWAVACLDAATGQAQWLRGVGEAFGANPIGIVFDVPFVSASGTNVFIVGNAYGTAVEFGNLAISLPGSGQYFARYDTNGNPQTAAIFGSPTTTIWGAAANDSGVYVCGDFNDDSQFGNDVIAAPVNGTNDLGPFYFTQPFVAKFDSNGNALWARNGVSSDFANFRGIALASDGVWADGFLKIANSVPAHFDTFNVYSDSQTIGEIAGGGISLVWNQGGLLTKITESSLVGSPVTLLSPQGNGTNFQFQFLSENGFSHNILYRTNLVAGSWQTNSTVVGDGTMKTISIPFSVFGPANQGYIRVSTQ